MNAFDEWLHGESIVRYHNYAGTASNTQVLTYNPDRFAIIISGDNSAANFISVGDSVSPTYNLCTVIGFSPLILLRSQLGDLITLPFWARRQTGTQSSVWVTCSYNPKRRSLYNDWIANELSKLSTP